MHWLGAVVAIGFLIVVHEAGHYVVARLCAMRVERFSIGFGPAVLGWRSKKSGTLFQIAPIPFGGFVEIRGMNIAEDIDPADRHAYPNRPAWQRFLTIFAGPATNYLTAIVLAFGLYALVGVRSTERWYGVAAVLETGASVGKLQPGDRVISVDGTPVWLRSADGQRVGLTDVINDHARARPGQPLDIAVRRDGKIVHVSIAPTPANARFFGLPVLDHRGRQAHRLGIALEEDFDYVDVGVVRAAREAAVYPVLPTVAIVNGLRDWIAGRAEGEVKGPVGMAEIIKNQFQLGALAVVELLMLLNVYLGLFNLFPLPALDGGRLAFLGYEMATRRRANPKVETMVHMVGILVLIVVMVAVTYKDVAALF
jgi:regulator of sigma E protease